MTAMPTKTRIVLAEASDDQAAGASNFAAGRMIEFVSAQRRVVINGRAVRLSKGEARLLAVLVILPGKVVARQQILASVWNWSVDGDPSKIWAETRLVDGQIAGLRRKLRPYHRLIVTVRGIGYKLDPAALHRPVQCGDERLQAVTGPPD